MLYSFMSRTASVKLDEYQLDAFERMKEEGIGDTHTERHKIVIDRGFRELGYLDGSAAKTMLRRAVTRVGDAFILVGLMMLGLTFAMPLQVRVLVVGPLLAGVTCYAVDRVLKRVEPSVSNRLLFWRGGRA